MKHCLLLCAAVLALAVAVPASAQYMYLDTNGDGVCTSSDVLDNSVTSIDFYIDTNHNGDGSAAPCAYGSYPMSINSYALTLIASGGVTYGAWTDNMGFGFSTGGAQAGNDYWVSKASATILPEGQYKFGSLAVTVTGTPTLSIVANDASLDPYAFTGFGTACVGTQYDNTFVLGVEFTDVCSSASPTAVTNTTWGQIKKSYSNGR